LPLPVLSAVLLGAFLHAAWNVFIRSAPDKQATTILVAGSAGAMTACWLPFAPPPALASWPYLAASVLIHVVYFSVVARLYSGSELSFAYPIMRGCAPALSAVVALALVQESPSQGGWSGVVLVSLGIVMLTGDSWRAGSLAAAPALLALANAGVIAAYTLTDAIGVRLSGHAASYTGWLFFLSAIPLVFWHLAWRGRQGAEALWAGRAKGLLGGACSVGGYGLALWAMTQAPIALVASLRETSVIFGTLIAAGCLKERVTPLRYLSALLITAGAVAVTLSSPGISCSSRPRSSGWNR
jgi:drug/metabolite transporter (DMT)-like permease